MVQKVSKILRWGELLGVLTVGLAILFKITNLTFSSTTFLVGLITLAFVYFLTGNIIQSISNEPKGLANYLITIERKIMYIGLSVLCVAYLFTILHLPGANEMMIIGLFTLVATTLIGLILILSDPNRLTPLKAPLIRSLAALVFYFLTPLLK